MICGRCNHTILPGQLYRRRRINMIVGGVKIARVLTHVACPSEREIQRAQLWGRWA